MPGKHPTAKWGDPLLPRDLTQATLGMTAWVGWHENVSGCLMTATEKFNVVKRACDEQKACQLRFEDESGFRTIFPLGICLTFNRGMIIVGYCPEDASSDEPALKNFPMEDCEFIRVIERKFSVWPDFLSKMNMCDHWLFHVRPQMT